jgi:hypothetical protein
VPPGPQHRLLEQVLGLTSIAASHAEQEEQQRARVLAVDLGQSAPLGFGVLFGIGQQTPAGSMVMPFAVDVPAGTKRL